LVLIKASGLESNQPMELNGLITFNKKR
jgi:hypothetical protein